VRKYYSLEKEGKHQKPVQVEGKTSKNTLRRRNKLVCAEIGACRQLIVTISPVVIGGRCKNIGRRWGS
jgi:hypothetical protein